MGPGGRDHNELLLQQGLFGCSRHCKTGCSGIFFPELVLRLLVNCVSC